MANDFKKRCRKEKLKRKETEANSWSNTQATKKKNLSKTDEIRAKKKNKNNEEKRRKFKQKKPIK